ARIPSIDVEPNASERSGRKSAAESLPGGTAIDRAIDAAPRTALDQAPREALLLIHGRIESTWVHRIDDEIDRPSTLVYVEDFLPRLPTVQRSKNAALLVRGEEMPHRGY